MIVLYSPGMLIVALIALAVMISLLLLLSRTAEGDPVSSAPVGDSVYSDEEMMFSAYEPDTIFDDEPMMFSSTELFDDSPLSDPFSDSMEHSDFSGINPASGLPMMDDCGIDVAGNPFGSNLSDDLFNSSEF